MQQAQIANAFGLEHIEIVDSPRPNTGPGQVLVEMRAASLNYRDYLVATGRYNPKMPLPRVLLSDGAGVVAECGEGVTRWKAGDRVAGIFMQSWRSGGYQEAYGKSALGGAIDGVLAEYVLFREEGLVAIPAHLNFEEGATLPCAALTAWHALFERGQLRPGETVLVLGSGGVSVFALQFAKAAGARVIALSGSAEKRERLSALGADWVLDYRANPDWGRMIAKAGGAEHIVEVGGVGTLEQSLIAAKAGGQVNVIGVLSGKSGELNIAPIFHKNLRMQGIYVGSGEMFERMNAAISQNGLRPVIDSHFPLGDIEKALRHMEGAGHFGKIVVTI
jgi:NADPH:quinone reductase-like Zn-dependent oxidoreductase